jgi:hypothetical protein
MTDNSMVRKLTNAELELVAGGTRGGETTGNTNYNSECGGGRSGGIICMPNSTDTFIGETFKNV